MDATRRLTPAEVLEKIPDLSDADIVWGTGPAVRALYAELTPYALVWQRDTPDDANWGVAFFNRVFFSGAPIPEPKAAFAPSDIQRVVRGITAAMRSFEPKHEHKSAVCGMLWTMFFEQPEPVERKPHVSPPAKRGRGSRGDL
jgi:hypothetical protein